MNFLLGFFTSVGPIASFFKWLGFRLTLSSIILPIQFSMLGALVVAKVAFFTAIITLIITIYNKINDVLLMITNLQSDSVLSLLFNFLNSIGFTSALMNAFDYFSLVFLSLFLLFISKMVVSSLQSISDEYYKIGMLLSTGWK